MHQSSTVFIDRLSNGLTVVVYPLRAIPKVVTQLWYNVGSKDEKEGERGLAHFLEHMLFKGTKQFSETDIISITNRLSGECNAFTSHDFTVYEFEFPKQDWHMACQILADTMHNCTFKPEHLTSEMKAVIQELKLYKDNYQATLEEALVSTIFAHHTYHHPIIGYKQDLWNMTRESLLAFYKKYYQPNNATLVVVGDVDPEHVMEQANYYFSSLPAGEKAPTTASHWSHDISSSSVTIYRDIDQPMASVAWLIPGLRVKNKGVVDALVWVLGAGRGSRLYKKLVQDQNLVTSVHARTVSLFENDLLLIDFEPVDEENNQKIIDLITKEIEHMAAHPPTDQEVKRALSKMKTEHLSIFEDYEECASQLGQLYAATHDPQYLFTYIPSDAQKVAPEIQKFVAIYLRPSVMHSAFVLSLPESDEKQWLSLQQRSDEEDNRILSKKVRTAELEKEQFAVTINPSKPNPFTYPSYNKQQLANGCTVVWHHRALLPKVDIILEFKSKFYDDPDDRQGLTNFVFDLIQEGTKNLDAQAFADAFESRGMTIETKPGYLMMSMLAQDLSYGLELLAQMITQAAFEPSAIERVREQILSDIRAYWDEPLEFAEQLARSAVYEKHPYSKHPLGSVDSIEKITREELVAAYKTILTPSESCIVIVGDIAAYDVPELLNQKLHSWRGNPFKEVNFPDLNQPAQETITYDINRDQMVLAFAGLSVTRMDPHFDSLLIFDNYFTGGEGGSMSSRLFLLREQTGLFYTIGGSLVAGSSDQPGMIFIRTLVSQENVVEFKNILTAVIQKAADEITQEAFEQAKNNLVSGLVNQFESGSHIAQAFLFLEKFKLPADYFSSLSERLNAISFEQMQKVVKQYLDVSKIITIQIGRI